MKDMKTILTFLPVLLCLALPAYALHWGGPEDYGELAERADVVLIAEVIDSVQVGKEEKSLLYRTRFKIWAVLKGDFYSDEWTYEHRLIDWSQFPGGMGNPPEYPSFSSQFRQEFLVFLKKDGEGYEACTGVHYSRYSFIPLPCLQWNLVEVRIVSEDTIAIAGQELPLSKLKEELQRIGADRDRRGIHLVDADADTERREAFRQVRKVAGELGCCIVSSDQPMPLLRLRPALIAAPPEHPFHFLKGQKSVTQSDNRHHMDWTFALKGDFPEIRKTVEAELLPQGFKITDDDPKGFGRDWRSVEYEKGEDKVILFENMRYVVPTGKSPYSVVGRDLEGWVSFQVILKRRARTDVKGLWREDTDTEH